MSQVAAVGNRPARQGVHRFRASRDLQGVARLLHEAFADELEDKDKRWLADLGALTGGAPILRAILSLVPSSSGLFTGFVWYENGLVVGNVSLIGLKRGAWVVANVATDIRYRRQGIARQLMAAALDYVADKGAQTVGLQVRAGNVAAQRLYLDLGFEHVGSTTTYQSAVAPANTLPEASLESPHGARVVDWTGDRQPSAARFLASQELMDGPWPPGALRTMDARLLGRIGDVLRGRKRAGWLLVGGSVRGAAAVVREDLAGPSSAEVAMHPEWRGKGEGLLVAQALAALQGVRGPVQFEVAEEEGTVRELVRGLGFRRVRTLDRFVLSRVPDQVDDDPPT